MGASHTLVPLLSGLARRRQGGVEVAREEYEVTFMTLRELIAEIESGEVPVLEYEPRITEGGYYDGN